MIHIVQSHGYSNCPEFKDIEKARKELKEIVAEELAKAKRKSKTATKHKLGEDNYSITLGRDRDSALWSAHSIQTIK